MEVMEMDGLNSSVCAARAAEVLRQGGVVLYPTDTLYGLGADALSDAAVEKIYKIKGREEHKPIHCIVADMAMAQGLGVFDERAKRLAQTFLPGPLTLIVKKREELGRGITRNIATIGIRIPNNDLCIELARACNGPVTTTSANVSGSSTGRRVQDILTQLGESALLIDLVIDAGELPESLPSTVVDISSGEPVILREGVISSAEICEALLDW